MQVVGWSSYKSNPLIHCSCMQYLIMKTTHLSLGFILISFYTISSLCAAAEEPPPVLDTDGKQLRAGVDYYILPVIRGIGGGFTLASTGNKTCPLDVVQEQSEVDNGLPLTFRPVNPKKGVIRESTDQYIQFSAASICVQSTVWSLDFDESMGRFFITTGGVEGNPGSETTGGVFKIEKYQSDYSLRHCPTCDFCRPVCGDIGILVQDGKRRLVVTQADESPLRVMFKKA